MLLSNYRDWIRASQAEAFSFKEQGMNERRIKPGETKYEPFKDVAPETLKKWEALANAVQGNGQTPTPPIAATAESVNQIQAQAMLTFQPLTAQQRITELNKKISEYKALLEIVQDATIKALLVKMFQNIEKELSEIGYQVAQIPTQKPVQVTPTPQPWNPNNPWGPTLGPIYAQQEIPGTAVGKVGKDTFLTNSEDGK